MRQTAVLSCFLALLLLGVAVSSESTTGARSRRPFAINLSPKSHSSPVNTKNNQKSQDASQTPPKTTTDARQTLRLRCSDPLPLPSTHKQPTEPPKSSSSRGGGDGSSATNPKSDEAAGAVAMQSELDAMEEVLTGAKSAMRELEKLIDAQTVKLKAMRALSTKPG
jgi:hypothetical protein